MPNMEAQIKEHIAAFVNELNLLVRQSLLENLVGALGGGAPARAMRGPRATRGARRGPRGGGDVAGAAEKILAHVKANDGQTIGQIVSATGVASAPAKKVVAQLVADGSIKKTGQRRGTRYHAGGGRAAAARAAKRGGRKARKKTGKRKARRTAPKARRASKGKAKTRAKRAPVKRKAARKAKVRPPKKRGKPAPQAVVESSPPEAAAAS